MLFSCAVSRYVREFRIQLMPHLNVLNLAVKQMNENRNDILLTNQNPVVWITCQNVQRTDRTFDNFLHANTIGVGTRLLRAIAGHRRTLLQNISIERKQ